MRKIITYLFGASLLLASTTALAQTQRNEMLLNAVSFINTPYGVKTLDMNNEEQLVLNTDEVDCVTLVENVLAMSLAENSQTLEVNEQDFTRWLTKIRYRNGVIDGYPSRLHYMTEWINNGIKQGFLEDITAVQSPYTLKTDIHYMTSHVNDYPKLQLSADNVAKMKQVEASITGQEVHYVPKDYLTDEGFFWIRSGDIIAITTSTPGLDVAHMGIAINVDGTLALLHASTTDMKVEVSKVSLKEMLRRNKSWTGVRVIRMKK
ncbi:MAG: DUF1460 domain-containing protein [Bacteroidaceae bacterium]|nr:DUF1460 domain-containing protein [Bacteroidaceae bacterium]MBR2162185.1 DUF1460 domain-containing protein [Bacteroidaceae bacterium]MBR3626374.1 DUF1460 domain-containing protein [Bacteroidaceae bacterium]